MTASPCGPGVEDRLAVEEHAEHRLAVLPVAAGHLAAVSAKPPDVGQPGVVDLLPAQELLTAKRAVLAAQADQPLGEGVHRGLHSSSWFQSYQLISESWHQPLLLPPCVRPSSSPPSSIGVPWETNRVVRKLRCWRAAVAERRIVGLALDAAVPGAVVVGAVLVVLEVGLVVLLVVGDEVAQREPVMGGDEVDRCERVAAIGLVQIAGARQPLGELADLRRGAPEVAHRVAVDAVPLRPQDREVADLVAAGTDIPRLGDQLDLGEHRVLMDRVEERRQAVDVVELASQRRRQVEAEAVDVALDHQVAQRVHDHPQHRRVDRVQRVAGAGEVHVVAGVIGHQPVVGGVVDALERQHRPEMVALGGVVVDDVEDHLDPGLVQRLDHPLELAHLLAAPAGGRVLRVGGEVADRRVAPVVAKALARAGTIRR